MVVAFTIRDAPTPSARLKRVVTRAVGSPARSNSFCIVAPLRVPVPQVAVRITPWTPAAVSSAAISSPNFLKLLMGPMLPVVLMT